MTDERTNPRHSRRADDSVQLVGVRVRPDDHFTRLWPVSAERLDPPLFPLLVLPVRLFALGLLWATATPGRLVAAFGTLLLSALAVVFVLLG